MLCVGSALRLEALGCGAKADEECAEYCMSCVDVGLVFGLLDVRHEAAGFLVQFGSLGTELKAIDDRP